MPEPMVAAKAAQANAPLICTTKDAALKGIQASSGLL
jgi:hypothetical protein